MLSTSWVRQTARGTASGHRAFLTKNPSSSIADLSSDGRSARMRVSRDGASVESAGWRAAQDGGQLVDEVSRYLVGIEGARRQPEAVLDEPRHIRR